MPAPFNCNSAAPTVTRSSTLTPSISAATASCKPNISGSRRIFFIAFSQKIALGERQPSSALVEPRQHELPMAERLGGGEAAVGGAEHALEQLVARLVGRHLPAEQPRHVDVDVLGHGAHGA